MSDQPSRLAVAGSVGFYLVAALVMVIANKWVLNAASLPMSLLLSQLATAVGLLKVVSFLRLPLGNGGTIYQSPRILFSPKAGNDHLHGIAPTGPTYGFLPLHGSNPRNQEKEKTIQEIVRGLYPLVGINVLGLVFNTYCLQYVEASFYQVARGLVLPLTVLFSYLILHQSSSPAVLLSCGLVCTGFFVGVSPSAAVNVSQLGLFFGVFSSATTACHAIVIKKSLSIVKGTLELAYWNNLLSAVLVLPFVILSGEVPILIEVFRSGNGRHTFIVGAMVTGLFGFLICLAGFLSIKVTSPVTHMISSAVRGVAQTFLAVWLFSDILTPNRVLSILIILAGSGYYTWVKDAEMRQAARIQLSTPPMSPYRDEKPTAAGAGAGGGAGGVFMERFGSSQSTASSVMSEKASATQGASQAHGVGLGLGLGLSTTTPAYITRAVDATS